MQLIYIGAPYRAATIAEQQANIADAKIMAQYYWLKGYAVICPHLNSANFDGLVDDEQFLTGAITMLRHCDEAVFHPRWEDSKGCQDEIEICGRAKIPYHCISEKSFNSMKHFVAKKLRENNHD